MTAHDSPRPPVYPLVRDHKAMAEHYADQGARPEDTAQGALHALVAILERLDKLTATLAATDAPAGHVAPRRGVWPEPVVGVVKLP